MPKLWTTGAPSAEQVEDIATLLRAGGVLLLPTDTIYGLHAVATNEHAVARMAELKDRDEEKPFVVIGASIEQLEGIGVVATPEVRRGLRSLWPAPLTAILPLSNRIAASREASSLGVRVPNLPWLLALLETIGPLASTSANRSGETPIESPDQLARDLRDRIDGIVDSGPLLSEPSTIVDFTGAEPRLIRSGAVFFTQQVWKTLRKSL
jgi:L-threonylcarbamoyladenylate synthase